MQPFLTLPPQTTHTRTRIPTLPGAFAYTYQRLALPKPSQIFAFIWDFQTTFASEAAAITHVPKKVEYRFSKSLEKYATQPAKV